MAERADQRNVIVVGFGPVGRAVTETLENADVRVILVETNAQTVATRKKLGKPVVHGNICDTHVLEQAGLASADALILTIPDEEASIRACRTVRQMAPHIYICVRVNHLSHSMQATEAGADHVTVQELVTAESMQQAVIRKLTECRN